MNNNKIILRPKKGVQEFVSVDQILYIESDGHLCRVYLRDEKSPITISMAIEGFFNEPGLPNDQFCRVTRSYIVNVRYVKRIREGILAIEDSCNPIRISCSRSEELKPFLRRFPVFPPLSK